MVGNYHWGRLGNRHGDNRMGNYYGGSKGNYLYGDMMGNYGDMIRNVHGGRTW